MISSLLIATLLASPPLRKDVYRGLESRVYFELLYSADGRGCSDEFPKGIELRYPNGQSYLICTLPEAVVTLDKKP